MSSLFDALTQLAIDITPAIPLESWQHSQLFSTTGARWNAYLNQICLQTFLPWLQAEYTPDATSWSGKTSPDSFWEVVNGTAISLGSKRLVLLPEKTIDTSEIRVPQEWVDIPEWAGDYYLAVQVDLDELTLYVWGFTTHNHLKTSGHYDPDDRTYHLEAEDLIQDLSVLWVVQQLNPDEPTQAAILPLPELSPTHVENLLPRLANLAVDPRLEIPFEMWGALLSHDGWRQRLCQLRQHEEPAIVSLSQVANNLTQWFQNMFEEGWQAIEQLLSPEDPAFTLRQSTEVDEKVIRRVKVLDLADQAILLLVTLEPEEDGRVGIRAQLRPRDRGDCLPATLSLSLVSVTGKIIQSVQAREQDNSIQLRRFKSFPGIQFTLQVAIDSIVITEDFVL